MRPVGWRYESYRHYLAAKGVRTVQMRMPRLRFYAEKLPEEQVAMERFDPERLRRASGGGHRVVFFLDDADKVLKVAKTPLGLQQNILEEEPVGAKFLYGGKDFVVMERASPIGSWYDDMLKARREQLRKAWSEGELTGFEKPTWTELTGNSRRDELTGMALEDVGLPEYAEYTLSGDVMRPSSWGIRNGKPVLIDKGSLDASVFWKVGPVHRRMDRRYPKEWLADWREVLAQRRAARRVGRRPLFALKTIGREGK